MLVICQDVTLGSNGVVIFDAEPVDAPLVFVVVVLLGLICLVVDDHDGIVSELYVATSLLGVTVPVDWSLVGVTLESFFGVDPRTVEVESVEIACNVDTDEEVGVLLWVCW